MNVSCLVMYRILVPREVPDHGVWGNAIASERNSDPSGMAWRIQGPLGVQISGQPQHTTTLGTEGMPWHEDHRIPGQRCPFSCHKGKLSHSVE